MTREAFDRWSQRSIQGFADQQVAAGLTSPAAALAYARRQFVAQLPDGLATPAHLLSTVLLLEHPPVPVGRLWMRVRPVGVSVEAVVLDVEIDPAYRGRGLGRATMLAAHIAAARLGATVVRLTVFGHNTAALALYEGLGYTVERALLSREVGARDAVRRESPALVLAPMTEPDRGRLRRATGADPAGSSQRGHHLWTAWDGAAQVGRLWLQPDAPAHTDPDSEIRAKVHHLEVAPALRGRGYGHALVRAAEAECRAWGAVVMTVALTGQDGAVRAAFCERLGFSLTAQLMARALAGRPTGPDRRSGWASG